MFRWLTKEELQMITDALLFTSSCDISADFNNGDNYLDRMVDLAEKLKSNPSQRLKLYSGSILEDKERSERIGEKFLIKHEK